MEKYTKLQNGSDIRGIAMDGVQGEEVNLTSSIARDIAASFGRWLGGSGSKSMTVAVGRDSRLTGQDLAKGVLTGLSAMGIRVINCEMASTPAMFMSTILPEFQCDGAIMITASHLPFNRNGLKFFTKNGGLEHEDIEAILKDCKEEVLEINHELVQSKDLISAYCENLCCVIKKGINSSENYDRPLTGFKIAVDAGNGAGGFFATKVIEKLGGDITGSLFLDPDGNFPNHVPNPENKEAMAAISGTVVKNACDLGVIFDTDVDRASAVDSTGKELSRNKLIALMASIVAEQSPNSIIVTDSVTSAQLKEFIEDTLGCVHHRFKRGYKNVINEAIRLDELGDKECLLAIETSGHGALKENYFLDDGAYLSAKIIIKAALLAKENKSIGDLLDQLKEPVEAVEYRIKITCDDFCQYGKEVLDHLAKLGDSKTSWTTAPDNYEGYRASVDTVKGWFLLRMSLHDPYLPLNIESDTVGGVAEIAEEIKEFLSKYSQLDISCFNSK